MGMGHAGGSVVPAQIPEFPSNEEIQRGTVSGIGLTGLEPAS